MAGDARRSRASRNGQVSGWLRALTACALVAFAPVAALADWSGTVGLYAVQQTATDIVVKASGATLFSAKAFAAAQYARILVEFGLPVSASSVSPSLHVRHAFHFVSLTGTLLAVRDEADVDVKGNAIPAGRTRFWTVDLKKGARYGFGDDPLGPSPKSPGAFVDLRSLFPEKAIAAAVAATPLGKQAGSKAGSGLPDVMYDLAALGRAAPNCFLPAPDTTWSFAIVGPRASAVPVDLGLQGQSNCRTKLTVLHLSLPRSSTASGQQLLPPAGLPETIVEISVPPRQ